MFDFHGKTTSLCGIIVEYALIKGLVKERFRQFEENNYKVNN